MRDPTEEILKQLDPAIQQHALTMVVMARYAGVPLILISGRRTPEQNRAAGGAPSSWHLRGLAFDVGLVQVSDAGEILRHVPRAEIPHEWWAMLGEWAEQNLGLRWGGRFVHGGASDVNHFDAGGGMWI